MTTKKGWFFSLGVGWGANNFSPLRLAILQSISQGLGPGLILRYISNGGGEKREREREKHYLQK